MRYICSIIATAIVIAMSITVVSAQESGPKVIHGGVLNGKAISIPKPEYPEDARNAGIEGLIRVEVTIDENGNVESAKALKDDAPDTDLGTETVDAKASLREAAERAALEAKFSPTLLSGQPVKVTGIIAYNFSLSEKPEDGQKAINGGILNSRAQSLPTASYPPAAKAVAVSGIVTVHVVIDENGNVISAAATSGHPLLRASAVAAARQAKFEPTTLERKPVKVSGVITYNFVLPEKKP